MTDRTRTYTQAEADALIAGAYLACAERIKAIDKDRRQYTSSWEEGFHDALVYMEKDIPKLAPDAARLALEERIAEAVKQEHERHEAQMAEVHRTNVGLFEECKRRGGEIVELQEREAKLIADTRLAAVEYCEQRIKECAAIRHGEKPAPHSTGHAIYFDQEKNRFEESFAIKFRDAILALTPANITAQAEERDRRVASEAHTQGQRDMREQIFQACDGEGYIHRSEISNQRLAAHRAAVQPGG